MGTLNVECPRLLCPALAEDGLHVLVRFLIVRELYLLRIPQQLALDARGNGAESHPLGVRTRDAEVRARRLAALARADPIALMTRRTRERSRRQLVRRPPRSRKQSYAFAAAAGPEISLRSDEHRVVAAALRLTTALAAATAAAPFGSLTFTASAALSATLTTASSPAGRFDLRAGARQRPHFLDGHALRRV